MKEIGVKIRKIRELKGYTQGYMAQKLDISQRAYSKMERQETKINWERINDIAEVLDIDPVDLVSFDDSLIFNNCSQSGKANNIYNNFPDELKQQYEQRINELRTEVNFLRDMLSKK